MLIVVLKRLRRHMAYALWRRYSWFESMRGSHFESSELSPAGQLLVFPINVLIERFAN
jgi:hypothetical protein